MTPERIAEIEAKCSLVDECSQWPRTLVELCRLALLGKLVEEAPTTVFCYSSDDLRSLDGKRVALVVLP